MTMHVLWIYMVTETVLCVYFWVLRCPSFFYFFISTHNLVLNNLLNLFEVFIFLSCDWDFSCYTRNYNKGNGITPVHSRPRLTQRAELAPPHPSRSTHLSPLLVNPTVKLSRSRKFHTCLPSSTVTLLYSQSKRFSSFYTLLPKPVLLLRFLSR